MSEKKPNTNLIKYNSGDVIFKEKAFCDGLFVIQSGQIEISRTGNGKRIPLGVVSSGEYLGELALLSNQPHTSTATALTEVEAIRIPKDVIDNQLKHVPGWLVALTKGLVIKLHHANEIIRRNLVMDENITVAINAIAENNVHIKKPKKPA